MKAVISNRIYINCERGSELDLSLCAELTYEISQQPISPYPVIIRNVTRISDKVVTIPTGRADLIPDDYVIVDKRATIPVNLPTPSFVPRQDQQDCIDYISHNGLVNAKPGWGKTIAGLGLAHKFQQKTLIITTTTVIRDMWIKEVEKWFGIRCGIIGGGKFDIDHPIVVGNIQTIRNKALEISGEFGLVIADEVHRSPAKTFTDTLNALKAKHKIGLSGTLIRKDGLHCVLPDYFGTDLFIGKDENRMEPEIHLWTSKVELSSSEFIPWTTVMSKLYSNPKYIQQVLTLADTYVFAGHKVLALGTMTDFLENLHMKTEEYSVIVTGAIKDRQKIFDEMNDLDSEARCMWGTQSIFSEGVSINALSCVLLAAPLNNDPLLEQIIGRIMREHPGKYSPVVIDIGLSGNTGKRQVNSRKKFYINQGWKVKEMGDIDSI